MVQASGVLQRDYGFLGSYQAVRRYLTLRFPVAPVQAIRRVGMPSGVHSLELHLPLGWRNWQPRGTESRTTPTIWYGRRPVWRSGRTAWRSDWHRSHLQLIFIGRYIYLLRFGNDAALVNPAGPSRDGRPRVAPARQRPGGVPRLC